MRQRSTFVVLFASLFLLGNAAATVRAADAATGKFDLTLRKQTETAAGSGRFHTVHSPETWAANETAIIVCDMWDLHHCLNATRRGAELAPRMDQVLKEARQRGATIIHAPSSCMEAYAEHPARKRAQQTPRSLTLPMDIGKWCYQIPSEERGAYPIDQSNGGEDDDPAEHAKWAKQLESMGRNPRAPWKSQTDLLTIDDRDYISDNGEEIWSILEQREIDNVILLGVHTNMCVLGRPFGLRQMARNGKHVVLMRDMTDTMYDPTQKPFVSHFTGTDLIVSHIERWVCPTITSDQLIGGRTFRFANDKRPRVLIVSAEDEYKTEETLPPFALSHLGKEFAVSFAFGDANERNSIPGIEQLDEADVLLLSVRRRALPESQMAAVRRFIEAGKPVVGIRTANHSFSLRGKPAPEGTSLWEDFDAEVIGGNYSNHYGNGPKTMVTVADGAADHPILEGVDVSELVGNGSLYVVSPLAATARPLLFGKIPDKAAEPIAWTNRTKFGGSAFYTSLGHANDFAEPAFQQLLTNAVRWAAKSNVRESSP
ncbi:MAG: isochorismatase family protein [Planctomycetales bacterium]|nr:isochorismatase family protein [Planctomycetales bacterium]